MKHVKLDFFSEVIVNDSVKNNIKKSEYHNLKGVVLGISEEDDGGYGYAILLYKYNLCFDFNSDELTATGKKFKREDFY